MLVMMTALITGQNAMDIMLNQEKMTRRGQKKLRRKIIAAMKWTLLTAVVTGKDKTMFGKVKSSTPIRRRWQNIMTKITWCYWPRKEAWNCLITDEIFNNIFSIQISIYLLSNLTSAAKVIPDSQTKLR
jgi:hypothetical protein